VIIPRFFSIVGHPLLTITLGLVLMLCLDPFAFGLSSPWEHKGKVLLLAVFVSTFVLPACGVALLKPLGMVKSWQLEDKQDRTGPYIMTGVFYLWVYKSFLSEPHLPSLLSMFSLGATIGLFLTFFINIFTKISAHAVGMGGLVMGVLLLCFQWPDAVLQIPLASRSILISPLLLLAFLIVFAGMVGYSRLALKAHTPSDLYLGYAVGAAAMLLADVVH
jgi:membrane-associated phospholipid phosphatase